MCNGHKHSMLHSRHVDETAVLCCSLRLDGRTEAVITVHDSNRTVDVAAGVTTRTLLDTLAKYRWGLPLLLGLTGPLHAVEGACTHAHLPNIFVTLCNSRSQHQVGMHTSATGVGPLTSLSAVYLSPTRLRSSVAPAGYTLGAFTWFIDQTIGGAVATGSHGSSLVHGSLSSQVRAAQASMGATCGLDYTGALHHTGQAARCQLLTLLHATGCVCWSVADMVMLCRCKGVACNLTPAHSKQPAQPDQQP
jgi:FAD/FMN-containing dehydrogenase